jgi:hypothetical protein
MDQTAQAAQAATPLNLPRLGAPLADGKFVGITTDKIGDVYALILLDDKPAKRLNFADAKAWAASIGALLPSKVESMLLCENLNDEFEQTWHWTSEQCSSDSAYVQGFDDGSQSYGYVTSERPARAVRRFPINSLILGCDSRGEQTERATLTKAQAELLESAESATHYLTMLASGVIVGPFDPAASCIRKLEDALRTVRFQSAPSNGAVSDAVNDPTDEAQRIAAMSFDLATVVGG